MGLACIQVAKEAGEGEEDGDGDEVEVEDGDEVEAEAAGAWAAMFVPGEVVTPAAGGEW